MAQSSNLEVLKKDLLTILNYYTKANQNSTNRVVQNRVRRVTKLITIINGNNQLQVTHNQLRDLIYCVYYYPRHAKQQNIPENEYDNLLIVLMKPFAQTMPKSQALKVAQILATHSPNASDLSKILKM